jgi:hypothetical protein
LNRDLVLPQCAKVLLQLKQMFFRYLAHLQLKEVIRDVLQPWPAWHLAPKAQAQRVRE